MNQICDKVLRFDRFSLDLARGCLRLDDDDVVLRPKTFDVLRYLVENAGRLVSKGEIYDAVWPNTTVTDDSLVQCVRELREKLGDADRRLIKTVHRRGYLLDAAVVEEPSPATRALTVNAVDVPSVTSETAAGDAPPAAVPNVRRVSHWRRPGWAAAAAGLVIASLGSIYLLTGPAVPVGQPSATSGPAVPPPHQVFRDCNDCPEMVALPAGEFMMGSPEDQPGRWSNEGTPRRIVIGKRIAISRFEVTVDQFERFVAETGIAVGSLCRVVVSYEDRTTFRRMVEASFRSQPGFEITGSHPAACVTWHDAQAYVAWLSRRTGKHYRLPTEAEWEYATRAGTSTSFSFGNDGAALCAYARFSDLASPFPWRSECRSEITTVGSLPVGTLKANPWGLHDVHGNVAEWVEDCWTDIPSLIPTDGSALRLSGNCEMGTVRGGSWLSRPYRVRSAFRGGASTTTRDQNLGLRIALTLEP